MGLENVRITEKEFSHSQSNQEVMFRRQRFTESLGYSITFFYSKQSELNRIRNAKTKMKLRSEEYLVSSSKTFR